MALSRPVIRERLEALDSEIEELCREAEAIWQTRDEQGQMNVMFQEMPLLMGLIDRLRELIVLVRELA